MKQIGEDSLGEESELELDDKAIRESEEKAINDFEDVDETDKEFFKLWNAFIRDKSQGFLNYLYFIFIFCFF
jgi:hypothetical protein